MTCQWTPISSGRATRTTRRSGERADCGAGGRQAATAAGGAASITGSRGFTGLSTRGCLSQCSAAASRCSASCCCSNKSYASAPHAHPTPTHSTVDTWVFFAVFRSRLALLDQKWSYPGGFTGARVGMPFTSPAARAAGSRVLTVYCGNAVYLCVFTCVQPAAGYLLSAVDSKHCHPAPPASATGSKG